MDYSDEGMKKVNAAHSELKFYEAMRAKVLAETVLRLANRDSHRTEDAFEWLSRSHSAVQRARARLLELMQP